MKETQINQEWHWACPHDDFIGIGNDEGAAYRSMCGCRHMEPLEKRPGPAPFKDNLNDKEVESE